MAGETFQFDQSYTQKYTNNVRLLLQDRGKSLRNYCGTGDYRGSKGGQAVQQFGESTDPHINLPRYSDTPIDSTPQSQVWVYPQTYEHYQLIDWPDQMKAMIDLQSPLTLAGTASMERGEDRIVMAAWFADMKVGENGGSTEAFSASQQVAVTQGAASATGLNVKKLKLAKKIMQANEVDFDTEECFCAITAEQGENLLSDIEVINQDYRNPVAKPILDAKGNIVQYLGFQFVHKERLPTDSSGYRRIPVWCKSGMHWGTWMDIDSDVQTRADKRHNQQIQLKGMGGCTRTENKKVVEIKCSE